MECLNPKVKGNERLNKELAAIKRGYDTAIDHYEGVITMPILDKFLKGESVDGRPNPILAQTT